MMKKIFYYMTIAAIAAMMTACGKSSEPEHKATRSMAGLRVSVLNDDENFHEAMTEVAFDLDYTAATATLTFKDITFAPRMPEITFKLTGLRLGYVNDNNVSITSTGDLTPMEGYTVNGVEGTVDFRNNIMRLKMNIVARGATYVTYVYSPTLYSYPQRRDADGNYAEYSNEEIHNILYRGTFSDITDTYFGFDIYNPNQSIYLDNPIGAIFFNMYNIQFVSAMPKMAALRASLSSTIVKTEDSSIIYTADSIIPEFKDASGWTPMASREMTNVKITINYASATYAIEFDCFGIHYTNSGRLYF
ncbi:MAG: hypothetical protein IJU62_06035 [Muribaculaceae bacterium]|nr:hypothetical protein [Muribaculaceae bacterium]